MDAAIRCGHEEKSKNVRTLYGLTIMRLIPPMRHFNVRNSNIELQIIQTIKQLFNVPLQSR